MAGATRSSSIEVMSGSAPSFDESQPVPLALAASASAPPSVPAPSSASTAVSRSSSSAASTASDITLPPLPAAQSSSADRGRIIIRTVNISLIASNVAGAIDRISTVARELGGWVVSSDRESTHTGFVSIRVPAELLDDALSFLRQTAVEVTAEASSSTDLTDEYVDNQSRLTSLRAAEAIVLGIMDRAESVQDALTVQRELVQIQSQIETILGRNKYLEQASAYSLINIRVNLAPQSMPVDVGVDQTLSIGRQSTFRATFVPPEDIEAFGYHWDFGDGSPVVTGYRTAPTTVPGERITSTVIHSYQDDTESPYIIEFQISATGPAGIFEGSDTLIATVARVPAITVFAGDERLQVDAGRPIELVGSFTRPAGLSNFRARWSFGDDSPDAILPLIESETEVRRTHTYENHRAEPFVAVLTITADSDAGEISAIASTQVVVNEYRGFFATGWDPGATIRTATQAVAGIGQALGTVLIWVVALSVYWIPLAVIAFFTPRLIELWRRRQQRQITQLMSDIRSGGRDSGAENPTET